MGRWRDSENRAEECIYHTQSGKFRVWVRCNGRYVSKTVATLEEAREIREQIRRQRYQRKQRKDAVGYYSEEELKLKEFTRSQIKNAKRSKVKRDGRTFTVIHLPDVPVEHTSWMDIKIPLHKEVKRLQAA